MVGCLKGHTSSPLNAWCRLTPLFRLNPPLAILPAGWLKSLPTAQMSSSVMPTYLSYRRNYPPLGDTWRCQGRDGAMNSKSGWRKGEQFISTQTTVLKAEYPCALILSTQHFVTGLGLLVSLRTSLQRTEKFQQILAS